MSKAKTQTLAEPELEVLDELKRKYVYVLANKNEERGRVYTEDGKPIPDPEFPPRRNLLMRSSIVWPGGQDPFNPEKTRKRGKYPIRYYDGCTTLFIDDQPREKEVVEQLINSTRDLFFLNGHLEIYGYDVMLKTYVDWASWNSESPYRIETAMGIYKMLDAEKALMEESDKMDRIEMALGYAKAASEKKMRIHAKFLNIAEVDLKTGHPLSEKALRAEYRREAMRNHENFIKTFNDKTLDIKAYIEKALANGDISTTLIPNRAVWSKKGVEITDISGLKSNEGILNKLIEFSQTKEGAEFQDMLKAIYE